MTEELPGIPSHLEDVLLPLQMGWVCVGSHRGGFKVILSSQRGMVTPTDTICTICTKCKTCLWVLLKNAAHTESLATVCGVTTVLSVLHLFTLGFALA